MTKRITALLLALLMVIGTIPAPAFATDGSNATEETTQTICSVCNLTDCTVTHIQCEKCGNYDCTADHTNWCDTCKLDNCGVDHGAVADITVCDVCGNEVCTCEPTVDNCAYCEETTAEDGTVTHAEGCNAAYVYDGTADVGKYAKLNEYYADSTVIVLDGTEELIFNYSDFESGLIFSITDWKWDPTTTALWYKVDACRGTLPAEMPAEAWILQNYTNDTEENSLLFVTACDICGEYDCATEHIQCGICGEYGCTALHFYCDICTDYDCGEAHLYCNVCGIYDCIKSHVWCGSCGNYDCGTEHENVCKPVNEPVIPEDPTLTEGADVSLVDEYGDPVTEEGFVLFEGTKSSLSAWSELEGDVSYQWQVCYDSANDLWADIRGQTGKGILVSPAMFLSIIGEQGTAHIRCVVATDSETKTSAAIPVTVTSPMAAFSFASYAASGASVNAAAEGGAEVADKINLIINYQFADGKTAANPWTAEIASGDAINQSITVPTIAGYVPTFTNADHVTLDGNIMSISYAAGALTATTTLTVTYQPTNVNVTVMHYWQNVDNDNYTLHETTQMKLLNGSTVGEVHETYPGFYNLLYEKPVVAADGSTVVEVYYDRYYYLMKFDLSGGYGVDPVYARYDAAIGDVGTPTRAGYTFQGWTLNGETATIPSTIPAENRTYVAVWTPGDAVNYTVVYWNENADDTNYSYWTQVALQAVPGTLVSGSDSVAPYVSDEQYFTYNDHLTDKNVEIAGDGSTIINVYYNRTYYTIYFTGISDTCVLEEHAHGTDCVSELICGANGHVHTADCQRTPICDITEHVHNDACTPVCGKAEHTEHTGDTCIICGKAEHLAHTEDCLTCTDTAHTHSSACCTVTPHMHTPTNCCSITVHSHTDDCCENGGTSLTHWWHSDSCCTQGLTEHTHSNSYDGWSSCDTSKCGLSEHDHSEGCVYCKEGLAAHIHSDENGCYSDEIHTHTEACYDELHTHSDACYNHTTHTHTEDCYTYQCGEEPHEHDDSCYRECYKPEHTHDNTCTQNRDDNVIYVVTAKYDQTIGDIWPTAANFPDITFRGWSIDGLSSTAVSKRINMTSDLCDTSDGLKYAEAVEGGSTTYLYYMFESFDQTSPANGNERILRNGVYYDKSELYYQEVNSGGDWNQKEIMGMDPVNNGVVESGSNVFLYYNRNRWDLMFHNVSEVVKTETDIMYEQPLANYTDDNGNLLSAFIPDYPTDSFEPGTMQFEGWYTTPECIEGTKVDFSTLTMPNSDYTLYANWVPVTRTVRFFLDADDYANGITIPSRLTKDPYATEFATKDVPHGSYLTGVDAPEVAEGDAEYHPYSQYDFAGWYYIEDGEEKRFVAGADGMPVTQDLDLYAKWSSNVLRGYTIYFALDADGDGVADTDNNGTIYVADPITGSSLAGNSRTFDAKGDTALYADYQSGFYPHVASHTIILSIEDPDNQGNNTFTFLYTRSAPVPYTVKYLEVGTEKVLATEKKVEDNTKAVVTENFVPVPGHMPDAYQKTLVVTPDGENEIIFWYTVDTVHALYQVNHYIQNLDGETWTEYSSNTITGDIGTSYSGTAKTDITGFTFSDTFTDLYNKAYELNGTTYQYGINAYTGEALSGEVGFDASTDTVSGTLTASGMQLNFYYVRNYYPYEVRYVEASSGAELHAPTTGYAAYGQLVNENYIAIGDPELYDVDEVTKSTTIVTEDTVYTADQVGTGGGTVPVGVAQKNIITFYYTRKIADLAITKVVEDKSTDKSMDKDLEYTFELSANMYPFTETSYAYTKYQKNADGTWPETGTTGYISVPSADGVISKTFTFTLKADEKIVIHDLPTDSYTISEKNLPLGYYLINPEDGTAVELKEDVTTATTFTNSYEPANLTVQKTVNVVEGDTNTPEVTDFDFTITVPNGVTGTYQYTVGNATNTATVTGGEMTITLQNGQTATFTNLPLGDYTVTEAAYESWGYNDFYSVNGAEAVDSDSATVTLTRGTTQTVECLNKFPVGDLIIEKTVTKEFYGTEWSGDTFTFTLERTTTGRPLVASNQYKVLIDGVEQDATIAVDDNGKLTVEITFDGTDAAKLDEETEANASASHTLTIKNLPAGTYKVTETVNTAYTQTPTDLTVSVTIPAETTEAEFVNQLKRPTGSLSLTKILEAATGFNPDELPKGTKFSFTIELTEQPPTDSQTFTVVYNETTFTDGTTTPTSVAMANGTFTVELEAGQTVTISGLPIGKYRITEATIPQYANNFAHIVNGVEEVQTPKVTSDGCLYTEINVTANATAKVKCTNTYPVDRAELVIQKLVTKEYDRDTLPTQTFTFTVTMTEEDTGINSYDYKVYNSDGTEDTASSRAATVTDRKFTVSLKAGQYAVIPNMPVCGYTVSENVDTSDYNASYEVYVSETGESASTQVNTTGTVNASGTEVSVSRIFSAGKTDTIVFTNEYKRHLGTLTITKTVNGGSADDTFIFHIKGTDVSNSYIDMDVTITGSGSVTIYDLPLGNYTVTEDTDWNWRYQADVSSQTVDLEENADAEVKFINKYTENRWLNYTANMPNEFGKKENE